MAFVAFMLIVGRRVIPWILHRIVHTGFDERHEACRILGMAALIDGLHATGLGVPASVADALPTPSRSSPPTPRWPAKAWTTC